MLTDAEERRWTLILAVQHDAKQGVPISTLVRRHQIDSKTYRRYHKLTEPLRISRLHRRQISIVHIQDIIRWIRQGRTSEWIHRALKRKGCVRGIIKLRPYIAKWKKAVPNEIRINRRIIQNFFLEDEPSNKALLVKILESIPF